jgi:hypothetical protein
MLIVGQRTTQNQNVIWLQDSLLHLAEIVALQMGLVLILLSVVSIHLSKNARAETMSKIASSIKPGGILVILLKFGMTNDEQESRGTYDVSFQEIEKLAQNHELLSLEPMESIKDKLARESIYWQTVILSKPDNRSSYRGQKIN